MHSTYPSSLYVCAPPETSSFPLVSDRYPAKEHLDNGKRVVYQALSHSLSKSV